MSFAEYTEEDKRLHDFVITHNRKLKDIKTIISNIMWSLCALCDSFEAFEFITADEINLEKFVRDFGFKQGLNYLIRNIINEVRFETRTPQKYSELQTIARKHDLSPNDLLKVAKINFVEVCSKE